MNPETKGSSWLHRMVKWCGPEFCYLFSPFVVMFYYLAQSSQRTSLRTFYQRLGYGSIRSYLNSYINFLYFAHSLIDRMLFFNDIARPKIHTTAQQLSQLNPNTGGILVGAHMGDWAQSALYLQQIKGIKLNLVMDASISPQFQQFFERAVEGKCKIIDINQPGVGLFLEIKSALEANEFVCFLADRLESHTKTHSHSFLGKAKDFPLAPFEVACILKKPILAFFCLKTKLSHHPQYFLEVAHLHSPNAQETSARVAALESQRNFVLFLEKTVRQHHFNWFNFFDVWAQKTPQRAASASLG
jgi:predicted LPLAT superfamily acyltransferase